MATLPIDLEWHLDLKGYRLVDHDRAIVANGGKLKHTRPLDGIDGLYKVFSNVRKPDELLQFVKAHGLLHDHSYKAPWTAAVLEKKKDEASPIGRYSKQIARASVNLPKKESVSEHLKTAELFRRVMLQTQEGQWKVPRSLGLELSLRLDREPLGIISLGDDMGRGFRLRFYAKTLMDGLWLQLAANVSGGSAFRKCVRCGNMFETGPGYRRADAKFCSDRHKIEFNSRKRTKTKSA